MSITAMKQALEALESYYGYMEPLTTVIGGPRVPAEQSTTGKVEIAITSLRQAIALQALHDENERLGLYKDVYEAEKQVTGEWKLVPRNPTEKMLKEMDECSTEGYDERLYAGHAASVYMAAVDAAPNPPEAEKQDPVEMYRNKCADGSRCLHGCHTNEPCYTSPPQRQKD